MFSEFIKRWLPDLELSAPPVDCVRCTQSLLQPQFQQRWSKFKCCTFQPFVANFQLGAIMETNDLSPLHGTDSRYALLPIGLVARAEFRGRYHTTEESARGLDFTCAFYQLESGKCGIWDKRPSECRFHFCLTDERSPQRERDSHRLFEWEAGLAQMALAEGGFTAAEISEQVQILNDGRSLREWEPDQMKELYVQTWNWARDFDKPAEWR